MVSRILGLVRDVLVTAVFGTTAFASAFYTAFTLPNLFRRLLGEGALTAAFVPTLSEELKQRERAGAFALVNQVASWLLVVSGGVVVSAMVALSWVTRGAPPADLAGPEPDIVQRWVAAADLAVILFPYLVFVSLAAVFSAALQTLQRFLEPALSPIWLNLSMITLLAGAAYGGWAAGPEAQVRWLCAGALAGGALQMIVPALALTRAGWRPRLDFSVAAPVRQILRLMGPTVFGSAIYLINSATSKLIGLSLNESAVALLTLATRLMELPIGVFAVAVSTVIFPLIAQRAAAGEADDLASVYRKGVRLILVINIPAALGLLVLATPIVRLLFEQGNFRAADTAMLQPVLVVFALGLPFFSFVNIVLRAYYAHKDTATPVRAALLSFVVNLGLSFALMGPFGTIGLAAASNVAIVAQAIYLQVHLTRKNAGLAFHHVWRALAKVIAASLAMGALVAAGWWLWARFVPANKLTDAAALGCLIGLGVASYGGLLWAMNIEGRDDLAMVLGKLRARFTGAGAAAGGGAGRAPGDDREPR